MPDIPEDIIRALEAGEIAVDQLRELIRLEAVALEMSFEQAVALAQRRELPKNRIGSDIDFLVELLPAS